MNTCGENIERVRALHVISVDSELTCFPSRLLSSVRYRQQHWFHHTQTPRPSLDVTELEQKWSDLIELVVCETKRASIRQRIFFSCRKKIKMENISWGTDGVTVKAVKLLRRYHPPRSVSFPASFYYFISSLWGEKMNLHGGTCACVKTCRIKKKVFITRSSDALLTERLRVCVCVCVKFRTGQRLFR